MRTAGQPAESGLGYMGHVEGLRAIAILLVVAAHAQVPGCAGGFVGVDVFFVISGYLISGLLIREATAHGRIDLTAFFARRIRRLLPAWVLVAAFTGVAGSLLVEPSQQPAQAAAAAAAALWISNLHFALDGQDYFAPAAETNLFLHTWSLGVEEQFYLLWPLLIGLILTPHAKSQLAMARLMFAVIAASFAASVVLSYTAPQLAFYMMPTRAWQFGLGALAFLYQSNEKASRLPASAQHEWLCALALVSLAAAAAILDGSERYPGIWALLPSLGTATLLVAAKGKPIHRFLSLPLMQWIGRRSYSWYLWHWPVLLLGSSLIRSPSVPSSSALAVLALLLAAASYRGIEMPIRRSVTIAARPKVVLGAGLWLAIATWCGAQWWRADAEVTLEQRRQADLISSHHADRDRAVKPGCGDDWFGDGRHAYCHFGAEDAAHTAVLIGDSVAAQWSPALRSIFREPGWRLILNSRFACPVLDEPFFSRTINPDSAACAPWRRTTLDALAEIKPDLVFLSATHNYPFSERQWVEGTRRYVTEIAARSGHVYIFRSTPILPSHVWACAAPQTRLRQLLNPAASCSAPAHSHTSNAVFAWQREATRGLANVTLLDLTEFVCAGGECTVNRDERPIFRDTAHLSPHYVRELAPRIAKLLPALRASPGPAFSPSLDQHP